MTNVKRLLMMSILRTPLLISAAIVLTFFTLKPCASKDSESKSDGNVESNESSKLRIARQAVHDHYVVFDSLWVPKEYSRNPVSRVDDYDSRGFQGRRITLKDACEDDNLKNDAKIQEVAIEAARMLTDKKQLTEVQLAINKIVNWTLPEPTVERYSFYKHAGDFAPPNFRPPAIRAK